MKTHRQGVAVRSADNDIVLPENLRSCPTDFRISSVQQVSYGAKRATFIVRLAGLNVEADLFMPEGRESFVVPASVREKYTGEWKRLARFGPEFSRALLEEVLRMLPGPPRSGDQA